MSFTIENDLLQGTGVEHKTTTKKSGKMTPKFLVIHYTASDNYKGDVATLSTSDRPASCHLVISPEGNVTQIGDFKDALWHAGESAWKGYTGLNKHSIGIEVTCPGYLNNFSYGDLPISDDDTAKTYYGKVLNRGQPYDFVFEAHKNGGPEQWWALFTPAQVGKVLEIGTLLMKHYGLLEAVGHDDIAPKRKSDPGPSCPVSVFRYLNGDKEDVTPPERPDLTVTGKVRVIGVAPEKLNLRSEPNGEKRGELAEGQTVEALGQPVGNWLHVRTPAGFVGWVWKDFVKAL